MMKSTILCFLTCFCTAVFGQTLSIDKIDEFTGSITRKTEYYEIGKYSHYKLSCAAARVDDTVFLELWTTADQGCAGAVDNYVIFLFDNGETYRNDKDENRVNCDDRASCFYVVSAEDFMGLTTSRIRLKMSDGFIDYDWSGTYSIASLIAAVQ